MIHETDSILMKEAKQSRIDAERKAKEWLKNDLKNNAKITFFFAPDSKKITQAEKEVLEDPCLKCNCCKRRFAQVSIIIVNAQWQGMLDMLFRDTSCFEV